MALHQHIDRPVAVQVRGRQVSCCATRGNGPGGRRRGQWERVERDELEIAGVGEKAQAAVDGRHQIEVAVVIEVGRLQRIRGDLTEPFSAGRQEPALVHIAQHHDAGGAQANSHIGSPTYRYQVSAGGPA